MLSIWICFGYNNWEVIHKELGRFVDLASYMQPCNDVLFLESFVLVHLIEITDRLTMVN